MSGDLAFAGTMSSQVMAIDWRKGAVVWTFEDPERQFPFNASPAVTGNKVIVAGQDKLVRALDAKSGKQLWKAATRARVDSSPAVVSGLVLVGSSDGKIHAFDLETGGTRWSFPVGAPITASPAVARERLVVGSEDGQVWCLDLRESSPAEAPRPPAGGAPEGERKP